MGKWVMEGNSGNKQQLRQKLYISLNRECQLTVDTTPVSRAHSENNTTALFLL